MVQRPFNPTVTMAALMNPSTNLRFLLQQQEEATASKRAPSEQPSVGPLIFCEACDCYLKCPASLAAHQLTPKHRRATGKSLTSRKATTGEKEEGIVIPKWTAFSIEQSALYDDARQQYMFSLYRRFFLRARM